LVSLGCSPSASDIFATSSTTGGEGTTSGGTGTVTGSGGSGSGGGVTTTSTGTSTGAGGAGGATGTVAGGSGGATTTTTSSIVDAGGQGGGKPDAGNVCKSGPNDDHDGDGYTPAQGDCNDCDPNVNPGAIEVIVSEPDGDGGIPAPADEDCDGKIDNVAPPCDDGVALDDFDPMNGARAIDLCQQAANGKWGVESAAYVRADGSPAAKSPQVGVLDGFGPNVHVQLGKRMLGLSSGHARLPGQPDACGSQSCSGYGQGTAPPGFPAAVPNCPGSNEINDDVALEVKLKAPTNATGYSFLFDFYSFEYPEWVCTAYNDQFIALVSPPPQGAINGNISFDSKTNPVSVNIAFFDVCQGCALGTSELQGTGFDIWNDAGATSWLKTQAPVKGGEEVTIRFAIWDTGDQAWDSTVLVDSFQWIANGGTVVVDTGHH
jgi:hypothetical protein